MIKRKKELFVLGLVSFDLEHFSAANFADSFSGQLAVLHFHVSMVFTFSLFSALYTIHHYSFTPSPIEQNFYKNKYIIISKPKIKPARLRLFTISFLIEAKIPEFAV